MQALMTDANLIVIIFKTVTKPNQAIPAIWLLVIDKIVNKIITPLNK